VYFSGIYLGYMVSLHIGNGRWVMGSGIIVAPRVHPTRRGGGLTIAELSGIIKTVMAASKQTDAIPKRNKDIPWKEFLTSHPPGKIIFVKELTEGATYKTGSSQAYFDRLQTPDLELYCDNKECDGLRFFECIEHSRDSLQSGYSHNIFLTYQCRNCGKTLKWFAIQATWMKDDKDAVMKFGEWPPFGPRVPSRVITLIREDRELFFAGRRAENQGMGIGAFAYYRRVVENQKVKIINEIIKVAQKIKAPPETIKELESARDGKRFTAAIESIKSAIPQVLLINGHNPLTLLHKALSEGLHAQTDEECLQLATSIRTILTDLAERLGQALKEQAEVDAALKHLMKSGSEKRSKAKNKSE
jgi:hypothetical protein